MNKHVKLAFIVAPFLLIGGYIAADYYDAFSKEKQDYIYELKESSSCNLVNTACDFTSRELKLQMQDKAGVIQLNSNFALDNVIVSVFNEAGKEQIFTFKPESENLKEWSGYTTLRELSRRVDSSKIRIVVNVGKSYFIKEMLLTF